MALAVQPPRIDRVPIIRTILMTDTDYLNRAEALLRAAGYRQPIMGGHSFDSDELVDAAERTGGKVYFTTHAGVGLSSAGRAVRRFDAFYQAAVAAGFCA